MRQHVLLGTVFALLAMSVFAQAQAGINDIKSGPLSKITIEGQAIAGDNIVVRKGVAYVAVPALARALGASVISQGREAVLSIPAVSETECEELPAVKKLSDSYRRAAVHIPQTIESIRKLVNQGGIIIPAGRFDEVDHLISEADFRAQTEADKAVSYALSHSNSTLAIEYYKLGRGVAPQLAEQSQMDSVLCSVESEFALETGRLSGNESCSVLQRMLQAGESKLKTTSDYASR